MSAKPSPAAPKPPAATRLSREQLAAAARVRDYLARHQAAGRAAAAPAPADAQRKAGQSDRPP